MPLFGAHLSVAGGLHKAIESAVALGMETVQLFTKNASQWKAPPLAESDIRKFRTALAASKLQEPAAHDSYLINLAAPADELFQKSIGAFVIELERAEALELSFVVTHPGAHTGSGDEAGLARIAAALNEVHHRCAGFRVRTLLETTAGQGTCLGWKFEHLADLLKNTKAPERLGVCFDTCHVHAAGYALGTDEAYDETFGRFDDLIGLERIRLFHVNDSVKGVGCRVDRHAGLGLGQVGERAFQRLVNDKRFAKTPMILETPKDDDDGNEMDPVNLGKLRNWCERKKSVPFR